MFGKVLVPIEFEVAGDEDIASDRAVQVREGKWVLIGEPTIAAMRLAAKLARGGQVTLVHATPDLHKVSLYAGADGLWFPATDVEALARSARKEATLVLERLGAMHCPDVILDTRADPGAPTTVIMNIVGTQKPDAIVLAASGRGRVRRAMLGSVADKVIRQAPCPVVVVPAQAEVE